MSTKFRKVNPNLGQQPGFGPFPAEQIVPWMVILFGSYYLCKVILQLNWVWTGIIAGWGMATWWVLTGSKPWRFLAKFVGLPYWVRGYGQYQSVLSHEKDSTKPKN